MDAPVTEHSTASNRRRPLRAEFGTAIVERILQGTEPSDERHEPFRPT